MKAVKNSKNSKKESSKNKELTPLEKARLARKNGTAKTGKKKSKFATWKLPEDFKNLHHIVMFKTDKDGMPSTSFKVLAYKGRIESGKENVDMSTYDPQTVVGIASRLSLVLFHPTGKETKSGPTRLPAKTVFMLKCYVSKVKGDLLKAAIREVLVQKELKSGKKKFVEIEKTDYQYRKIRKANRYLAAAYQNLLPMPKPQKRKRKEADDE